MEYYDDELTDEEIELMLKMEKRKKIKKVTIISVSFAFIALFVFFSIFAYYYNPSLGYTEDIVIRNDF